MRRPALKKSWLWSCSSVSCFKQIITHFCKMPIELRPGSSMAVTWTLSKMNDIYIQTFRLEQRCLILEHVCEFYFFELPLQIRVHVGEFRIKTQITGICSSLLDATNGFVCNQCFLCGIHRNRLFLVSDSFRFIYFIHCIIRKSKFLFNQ